MQMQQMQMQGDMLGAQQQQQMSDYSQSVAQQRAGAGEVQEEEGKLQNKQ